jgi:hypothetical protein
MLNRFGKKYGYNGLFPIRDDRATRLLRAHLQLLDKHEFGSPFSGTDLVHLARFIIIDQLPYQGYPAKPERRGPGFLVFMCDFDGSDVSELAQALATACPEAVHGVWQHCDGFPFEGAEAVANGGAEQLAAYLRSFQSATLLYLADQPDATVGQILRAMRMQMRFADFVAAHQGSSAKTLRADFAKLWAALEQEPDPRPGSL